MVRLSESFLAPYRARGDVFPSLLARSVYLSKYCRGGETWTDTIHRVVGANVALDADASTGEAEALFDLFWNMRALPPGRGLYTGGVPGMPVMSLYNCYYVTLRSLSDWEWMANRLLEGGGVGVGLNELGGLPVVQPGDARLAILCSRSHPNEREFFTDALVDQAARQYIVPDTRQGWASALHAVMDAAHRGCSLTVNVSAIRPRGAPIRTFGGIAPGPAPLVTMLRNVWSVIRGAVGRRMSTVEALDTVNHTGACIRSGGVRRSAIIQIGDANDMEFRRAKHDFSATMSHRSSSNNSIAFRSEAQLRAFDWAGLVEDNAKFGEPGFLNLHRIWEDNPEVKGTNPCFRGDTLVHTKRGHFPIRDLVGRTVDVWDGSTWRNVSTFEKTSEHEPMLKFRMQDGSEFAVTPYHIIVTEDGRRIEAKDVVVGERLKKSNAPLSHGAISEPSAYLKGFLIGDGTTVCDGARAGLALYKPKYGCMDRLIASAEESHPGKVVTNGIAELGFRAEISQGRRLMTGIGVRHELAPWCREYKKRLPVDIFAWDLSSKAEFIAGIMDADGTAGDNVNGFMYQICSTERGLLLDVQQLLKTLGVFSKVTLMKAARKGGCDGYDTLDCWRLTISQVSAIALAKQVKFTRLKDFSTKETKNSSVVRRNIVESIESDGIDAAVYCLVTNDPDQIAFTNGLIIGRCGEALLDDYEACCLSEVFPSRISRWDLNRSLRLLTRYTLRQRLQVMEDPLADAVRVQNMRIGVGLGGICEFGARGMRDMYTTVRDEAWRYATDLGVNTPITCTVVKPSGTISTMAGVTHGVHAAHAPYYLRRTRIMKNEPIAAALIEAGVPYEDCLYDQSGNTHVFAFPMKSHAIAYSASETVTDQLNRILKVQEDWADQAVSATVSFSEHEVGELTAYLQAHGAEFKSLSCLPRGHAYPQAPFETIDEASYSSLSAAILQDHPLVRGGNVNVEECEGGVCPVQ